MNDEPVKAILVSQTRLKFYLWCVYSVFKNRHHISLPTPNQIPRPPNCACSTRNGFEWGKSINIVSVCVWGGGGGGRGGEGVFRAFLLNRFKEKKGVLTSIVENIANFVFVDFMSFSSCSYNEEVTYCVCYSNVG